MMIGSLNTGEKSLLNAHVCCAWSAFAGTRARVSVWSYESKQYYIDGEQAQQMAPFVITVGNDRPVNMLDQGDPANIPFFARCEAILVKNGSKFQGFELIETPIA